MNTHSQLDNVLLCLSENSYTISSLISDILLQCYTLEDERVRSAREDLEHDAMDICARLLSHIPSSTPVTQWALQITRSGASERNTAIQVIKCVVCISIILQSANETCNHLQSILRIFVHSANVPQRVAEVLAHTGLTISIKSVQRAVKSMSTDSAHKIKKGLRSLKMAIAYDNFDINFKTSEPTLARQLSFVSATSTTSIPLIGVDNIDVLHCSEALFHVTNTYDHNPQTPGMDFSPQRKAFVWHVREILINHGQYFGYLSDKLDAPETLFRIPVSKTDQVPMRSMKIKQSSVDGNVEPDFASTGDVDISEFVLLVHVWDSRHIEDSPRNQFQFVVFVLGLFHFKMHLPARWDLATTGDGLDDIKAWILLNA
ncbi:hypothetical protein EI94DRAFT_1772696 [Lactarius quietus]|nr:hypothetical protein EI94DRAFT_1772696 [Lactarius quietus]